MQSQCRMMRSIAFTSFQQQFTTEYGIEQAFQKKKRPAEPAGRFPHYIQFPFTLCSAAPMAVANVAFSGIIKSTL